MSIDEWYNSWLEPGEALKQRQVFYVLGCQKSGTTWLQHLFNSHPNVCCGGEGHLVDLLAPLLEQAVNAFNQRQSKRGGGCGTVLDPRDLFGVVRTLGDRMLAGYLAKESDSAAITAVGDKTPEHAKVLPLLADLYPKAKFIHIIRDGRDACISGWFHLQRQGENSQFPTLADYAAYFAERHWSGYIDVARAAARNTRGRYIELRYEELHSDPGPQVRRMLEFLQVDASQASVEACIAGGSFEKLTQGRTRGSEDRTSFFRKGAVGDWQAHFDEATELAFAHNAGGLLEELGYACTPAEA